MMPMPVASSYISPAYTRPAMISQNCICQPTPAPTPKPTIAPPAIPPADLCKNTVVNGAPLPACVGQTFFPMTPGGLYRRPIPANAAADPNSSAMVKAYFGATGGVLDNASGLVLGNGIGQRGYDYSHPLYLARTSDPLINLHCTTYCAMGSVTAYIPAQALAAGGSDQHISLLEPDNTVIDGWGFSGNPPYHNGQTINVSTVAVSVIDGSRYSSNDVIPGWMRNAFTAGGMISTAGDILLSELQAGSIQHEIYIVVYCTSSNFYFPASQSARICSDGRVGIPDGALLRYKLTDSQIASSSMSPESKIIATALHDFGGRVSDTGGVSGLGVQIESEEPAWSYGGNGQNQFINYAIQHQWNHIVNQNANPAVDRFVKNLGDMDLPDNLQVMASGV